MRKKDRDKKIENAKAWIEVYHRDKWKTAVYHPEEPNVYHIITSVNYLTSKLWMVWRNNQVNDGRKGFVVLPTDKPNWLIMNRNFKRKQERMIKVMEYLEVRKNRVLAVTPINTKTNGA